MQSAYRTLDATKILSRRELATVLNDLKRKAPRSKNTRLNLALFRLACYCGLGRLEATARLLPVADSQSRNIALALAAQHGHPDVLRLLLDAGEDPSRYNPDGYHSHSTPLHQAVWFDHADAVRLLVERGARLDIRDTVHHGTPLDWAIYGGRTAIAEYLRGQKAPTG